MSYASIVKKETSEQDPSEWTSVKPREQIPVEHPSQVYAFLEKQNQPHPRLPVWNTVHQAACEAILHAVSYYKDFGILDRMKSPKALADVLLRQARLETPLGIVLSSETESLERDTSILAAASTALEETGAEDISESVL